MKYENIGKDLFIDNRKRLVKELKPGSIAIFNSNDIMPTNADGTMAFRQNNDLLYLSGIDQEESILVLCPDFPDKKYREVLFLRETNDHIAVWEGHKLTKKEATDISGVETVLWIGEFEKLFHHMMVMGGVDHVYLPTNEHYRAEIVVETRSSRFVKSCQAKFPLHKYHRIAPLLAQLRAIKQPREIELSQKACNITEKGFRRILNFVKPGVKEYEIEAEFIHEFIRNKSKGFAYSPIIASGANACVLHYVENAQPCKDGDVLLLDVGAEYANYNADMTRSIPVNGRYTKRQKEVYNAVLRVMRAASNMLRPGVVYFDYHKEVQKMMESELLKLKLISKKDLNNNTGKSAVSKYFMHGTGHHLGLDVHDTANMYAKMQVGMLWTVEPGIYIPAEKLGIRLENNVLIGKNKNTDLMKNIPIEAEEIEDLMNQK
jgi:Xaa-Pro aminopeptidase